ASVRTVVVDAFLVDGFNAIPRNARIGAKTNSDVAYDVLHKPRVVICLHRDVPLVDTLQERIDRCRCRSFRHFHEFLDPHNGRCPFCIRDAANLDAYVTPLVVRTVVTDCLAAWTQAGDRYLYSEQEVMNVTGSLADEPALVVHEGHRVTYRCSALQEIGELHFNARSLCLQTSPQFVKNDGQRVHRHLTPVVLKDFDEATHVRAAKVMREVDRHGETCNGLLGAGGLVENDDWVPQVPNTDMI